MATERGRRTAAGIRLWPHWSFLLLVMPVISAAGLPVIDDGVYIGPVGPEEAAGLDSGQRAGEVADGTAPRAAVGEPLDAALTALGRPGRTAVAVLDEPVAVAGMLRIVDIARAAAQPRPTSEDRRWQRAA